MNNKPKAVIYCRVSTREQVEEGNSLVTQERACKEYAKNHDIDVARIFVEQGESAKTADRKELQKLISYCSNKKNEVSALIIYKIDRLSRQVSDYTAIKALLKRYGVEVHSISERIEDNPAGKFMEIVIAGAAQFDNDLRAERCSNGMKEAVREGRYVWRAPIGYSNVRVDGKATIAPNEMAPYVQKAFGLIATGKHHVEHIRLQLIEEGFRLPNGKPISRQHFYSIVRNKVYMGVIDKFDETHPGLFEPIVTSELFNVVQKVLNNNGRKPRVYKRDNADFPLRRFIFAPNGEKITGSWSRGSMGKRYPFYHFRWQRRNVSRDELHESFEELLADFAFRDDMIFKLKEYVRNELADRMKDNRKDKERLLKHIDVLKERQNALVEKNLNGIISDGILKQQLDDMDGKIVDAQTRVSEVEGTMLDPMDLIEYTEQCLKAPGTVWKDAPFETKIKLQWFQFPKGIVFDGQKCRTQETSLIFETKNHLEGGSATRVVFV